MLCEMWVIYGDLTFDDNLILFMQDLSLKFTFVNNCSAIWFWQQFSLLFEEP